MAAPNASALLSNSTFFPSNLPKSSPVHRLGCARTAIRRQEAIWCSPWNHLFRFGPRPGVPTPQLWNSHLCLKRQFRVKGGDIQRELSSEDIALDVQTLQRDLDITIKEENYSHAAKLRDVLRALHEDSKASVLAANGHFYNAFRNGDLVAMHSIWAKGDNIYCVHPGAGGISGYDLVMASWELVCGADHEFPLLIDLKNIEVHVRGDVGYVTCLEVIKTKGSGWGKQVATNVFEKIDGQWLICIHHASHIDL